MYGVWAHVDSPVSGQVLISFLTRKAKPGSGEDYSKIKFTGLDVVGGRRRLQYLTQVFGQVLCHSGKMGITGGKIHKNGKMLVWT